MSDPVPTARADGLWLPRTRRAPYPVSPTIGPDGLRACQEILDAARRLFAERGYHGTSIQAIAEASGRSDTAVYQYFRGKQEIFRILFEELGADLIDLFGSMPVLTADLAGLAEFQVWLERLGAVLRQHSPVFADWPLEGEPAVENPSEEYLRQLGALIHGRLAFADTLGINTHGTNTHGTDTHGTDTRGAGSADIRGAGSADIDGADTRGARNRGADTPGVDTRALSIAIICIVEWAHIVLDAGGDPTGRAVQEKALHDTLARVIHRAVFPAAHAYAPGPDAVPAIPWAGGDPGPAAPPAGRTSGEPARWASGEPAGWTDGPAGWMSGDPAAPEPGLRKAVTARARPTIEKVLAAAVAAFEQRGLAGTSVNDVIARAGVAHGSFYQYWTDRNALFTTLAHRAAIRTREHFDGFLDACAGSAGELDRWLDEWLDIVERHGTVFHIWALEILETPQLWPVARAQRAYLDGVIARIPRRRPSATPLEIRTGTITVWTLLAELPYNAWLRHAVLTREEVLACQRLFLARGILGEARNPQPPAATGTGA